MSKDPKKPRPIDPVPPPPADTSMDEDVTIAMNSEPTIAVNNDDTIAIDEKRPSSSSGSRAAPSSSGSSGSIGSVGVAGPIPSAPKGELPKTIGSYRILGKLGEGGMGIVYDAEQQDPKRRVALKVVRGGRFVDEQTIRLFRREAETLARLRHPNIGAIYESGHTEDGHHYFAMELVVGENLDKYLAKRPKVMTPEEVRFRLSLFRKIAEAVNYAHQRGVIHRDLKPSNIIISSESASEASVTTMHGIRLPDLKILDFGLARITEGDVNATQVTEVGVIKGTLPYMSPEQARGNAEKIDVRTDVYALGVILFEMLSSTKPYDVNRNSLIEAVRVICEEPPRSLRNSISGTRRLDPDIETIVGKALEKDAERRYSSAAAMAEDVERYLSSQPIMARPPTTMYQIQKFAARNRGLVIGVAATFIVLVAGIVASTYLAVRATKAETLATQRMAQAEAAEARAVADRRSAFSARSLAELRQIEADSQKVVAVKERGVAIIERGVAAEQRQLAEASSAQAHQEAAKAGAINRFLQDMLATADPWAGDGGKVTLDAALERAQKRIGLWAGTDADVDYAIRGVVATAFAGVGRYNEAEGLLKGGLDQLQSRPDPHPALVAGLHRQLGLVNVATSRYDLAEQHFRQALANQLLAGSATSDTAALMTSQIASALAYQGHYAQADTMARSALELVRRSGTAPNSAEPVILRTRAYIEANGKENYSTADDLLRQSIARLEALPGEHTVETSEALEELAQNRVHMGDMSAADSLYRQAVTIRRKLLGDNHPLVARALESQSEFLIKSGKVDQTIDVLTQVLAIRQRGQGPESAPVGRVWVNLAPVYTKAKRYKEAQNAFDTGIAILKKRLGERHPDLAKPLKDYADLKLAMGKQNDAEKLTREALAIRMKHMGATSSSTIALQLGLADMLQSRKSSWFYPQVETLLTQARAAAVSARGTTDAAAQRATQGLVQLYDAWSKPELAAKFRAMLPGGAASKGARSSR